MSQKKLHQKKKTTTETPQPKEFAGPLYFEFPKPWNAEIMQQVMAMKQAQLNINMICKNLAGDLPGFADESWDWTLTQDGKGMVGKPKVPAPEGLKKP